MLAFKFLRTTSSQAAALMTLGFVRRLRTSSTEQVASFCIRSAVSLFKRLRPFVPFRSPHAKILSGFELITALTVASGDLSYVSLTSERFVTPTTTRASLFRAHFRLAAVLTILSSALVPLRTRATRIGKYSQASRLPCCASSRARSTLQVPSWAILSARDSQLSSNLIQPPPFPTLLAEHPVCVNRSKHFFLFSCSVFNPRDISKTRRLRPHRKAVRRLR